ncbi:hypothetical protein ABPG75_003794 [Micractinium tetrahymenae]
MRPVALLLLCLATCAGLGAVGAAQQPRLRMQPITVSAAPAEGAANGGLGPSSGPERFSGYFKLNRTYDAHMFFFYFQARVEPENAPVVLWMTGGPGCSSELAVFFENGPWNINKDLTLTETKYGWDAHAHMIFVDQPINTGFSYSEDPRDRCYDEACVSNDMVDFLSEFFKARPELQDREFFVTGESYAGHYVPAVASRVFHASRSGEVVPPINLQGLAIGNGLTDPAIQYGAYSDYALMNGLIGQGMHSSLKMLYPVCRLALNICDGLDWSFECLLAVEVCQITQFAPIMAVNPDMNVYDIRKKCEGPLCYREFEILDDFLNQDSVRKELGVGDREWEACNMDVHSDMMADWGHNFDTVLPELLAAGVRVMIYVGDQDLICNWVGNKQWVDALPWAGAARWSAAAEKPWIVRGKQAGTVQAVGPLSFVRVHQAGHMVPMDQGLHGLDMITRFTRNMPLAADDDEQTASSTTSAAEEQPRPAASEVEVGLMKRGAGEQTILAGATWQIRRAQPGGHGEQ